MILFLYNILFPIGLLLFLPGISGEDDAARELPR